MSTIVRNSAESSVNEEIQSHVAWYGNISGLAADKMLRGRENPFLYILRAGENKRTNQTDYYVSFILADLSIRHQPFVITTSQEGWYYENTGVGGPYVNASIEDVLYMMMHCEQGQPTPLSKVELR